MKLSALIRNYRMEHGLTLEEMGNLVGVSKAYMSMLEKNRNSRNGKPIAPSFRTLRNLATAMNISMAELTRSLDGDTEIQINAKDGKETPDFDPATLPSHSQKPMTITSEKEKSLVKKYRVLDDTGKASVDAILDVQYNAAMAGKYEIKEKMA